MFVSCKITQIGSQYKDPRITIVVDQVDTNPDTAIPIDPITPVVNGGNYFGNYVEFNTYIDNS